MSVSVSPSSLVLSAAEYKLRLACNQFVATHSSFTLDKCYLRKLFIDLYCDENKLLVGQHLLRLLLGSLIISKSSLSAFFANPLSLLAERSSSHSDSAQLSVSENLAERLFNADFCAYVLKKISLGELLKKVLQIIEICLADPLPAFTKIFYQFVDILGENFFRVKSGLNARFLETLLLTELDLENLPQLIIGIVLIDSSRDSYLSQNISHYLQSNFISFVDKSKDKGLLLLDILLVEKEFTGFGSIDSTIFLPLESLSDTSNNKLFASTSPPVDQLLATDYIDLEDKDLETFLESMSTQNLNLLAQQIKEIGVQFTLNVETCEKHLSSLIGESNSINNCSVAKVIIMMMNTCSSVAGYHGGSELGIIEQSSLSATQPISWNPKVFAAALRKLGTLSWCEVVMHLDDPSFFVKNKVQLQFLTTFLLEALGSTQFPVGLIYREWNYYKAGQLSWIEQILKNPDVFCFVDYPHRPVNTSLLKVQSEEGNRDLSSWHSLDLLEILLKLSEVKKLSNNVAALIRKPMSNIPDILVLALIQLQPQAFEIRRNYLETLIPSLVNNHPNAIPVLNAAWNCDELVKPPCQIRAIILSSLCLYYEKSTDDFSSKLNRILELAHELKPNGLAELFNVPQYPFSIDLACLASRRDFLKLDKWVEDKLAEQGVVQHFQDQFARHLISYIKQRFLHMGGSSYANAIPQDTVQVLLSSLSKATSISSSTISELQQIFLHLRQIQAKDNRPVPVNVSSRTHLSLGTSGRSSNLFTGTVGSASTVQQNSGTFNAFSLINPSTQPMHTRQQQQNTLPVQVFNSNPSSSALNSTPSGFAQQTELIKPNFGATHTLSMSPSGQMLRNFIGSNGSTNRATSGPSGPGWGLPSAVAPTTALRTTPGPIVSTTGSVDFRAQLPPAAPTSGTILGNMSGFGHSSIQQHSGVPLTSSGRLNMPVPEDLTKMHFSEEIQNEANMYFQQIYAQNNQMPVQEFLSRLKVFKNSSNQRDRDILSCVVKNLFEEYRFFREYPERELRTTAEVYGGIIREGIVTNLQFATAVKKVLESLQSEPGSMLWTFGIVSLTACRQRLCAYPKVCLMLAGSESFQRFPQILKDFVTAGIQGHLPPGQPETSWQSQRAPVSPAIDTSLRTMPVRSGPSVLSVTSVDTLICATEKDGQIFKQPPADICEKVAFLFNNLSKANLPIKIEEMKQIVSELGDEFLKWLAQYLVMRRVSIEQNFQPLYKNFVESLADKNFEDYVKEETFRNIRALKFLQILLRSDKRQAASNFGDRQLLKNLGLWLGSITIADDHPITIAELDMKSLLMEAYYKGQEELLFVVPFIAKILSSCCKSTIFGPNCAWIRAILRVMAELHLEPDLKLNLKFEIEVLCKELGIDLRNTPVEGLLKDTERLIRLPQQLSELKILKQPEVNQFDFSTIGSSPVASTRLIEPTVSINTFSQGAQQPLSDVETNTSLTSSTSLWALAGFKEDRLVERDVEMYQRILAKTSAGPIPQQVSSASASHLALVPAHSLAHFHYHDINVVSLDGLTPHIKMSASLPLFQVLSLYSFRFSVQVNPQLKHVVKPAICHALKELMGPLIDKSLRITLCVAENLCKKISIFLNFLIFNDFALDGDEQRLRRAAHNMVRSMSAAMTSIVTREPLRSTILSFLKQAFSNHLQPVSADQVRSFLFPLKFKAEIFQMKLIDEAAMKLTEDNIELATSFCTKTACEKAIPELDKRLESEYIARKQARRDGKQYVDPVALAHAQQLPEKLRPGPMTAQQMAIYDEFSGRICGFKPTTAEDMIIDFNIMKSSTPNAQLQIQQPGNHEKEIDDFVRNLQLMVFDIDSLLAASGNIQSRPTVAVAAIRDGLSQLAMNPRDPIQFYNLIQRMVEQLLHAYKSPDTLIQQQGPNIPKGQNDVEWFIRLRDVFVSTCRSLCSQIAPLELARRITRFVIECRLDCRFNIDALDLLIKHSLIQLNVFDQHLALQIEGGNNFEALIFAQRFVKANFDSGPRQHVVENFPRTLEQLAKIQQFTQNRPTPTDSFHSAVVPSGSESPASPAIRTVPTVSSIPHNDRMHLPNISLNVTSNSMSSVSSVNAGRFGMDDADSRFVQELQSKAEFILREWIQMCYSSITVREPQQVLAQIVHIMHEHGVLSTDEMITKFFRICTEMCVDVSYRLLKSEAATTQPTIVRQRCYYTLDAFVKLSCLMIKYSDGIHMQMKVSLLKKILNIVTTVLTLDHGARGNDFHAMPYHRIIIGMFNDLSQDPILESVSWNILEAFGQALFVLQPRRVPGFAFSWLDIVGHRNFIARLLKDSADTLKTTAMYTQLIISHLKFLAPFLRNIHLPRAINTLYKGTLRVLLVILHDFPELLCEYHLVICDVIPPNCVQLRNLVLSAYPKNMRLPDPFGSCLKMEGIAEMSLEPKIHINMATIIPVDVRTQLDDYLTNRSSIDFLAKLPGFLQVDASATSGCKYNMTVLNAVVLYAGMRAIQNIVEKQQCITMATIAHTAYMDIFQSLSVSLCTEGRYLLFNAIANQLRYPNSHTHYFSCTLLYLFLEANTEIIQEQITRILFERLVALRPHPWGLLITFVELIKNPIYGFWKHKFVRCAPEIERQFFSLLNRIMALWLEKILSYLNYLLLRLFQSVAHSCMAPGTSRTAAVNASHNTQSSISVEDSSSSNI
ncbi:unnamed protein product [Dracunculus medinensis]|uniref:CCR4-NOT transcription complex subunit 1 n=1 Tax=Dracunculus medinensis TaxID=318479 RepID=A0A158Q5X8_DRAME|nr:unnamed protein product [Dracunculus medinensis]